MDEDSGSVSNKKRKMHEAQLIPGVDGVKVYGFPNSIITKLRYCDSFDLNGTTGSRALNVFAANGIFDPDITGTGHQPMYHDNWFNLYNHYVVLGSKITVHYAPKTADVPSVIGIMGNDDSTVTSNVETLMESNNAISTLLGVAGSPLKTLVATYEPLEMTGIDAKDDGAARTAFGQNPSELWCWAVWAASADGASTVAVSVRIEIEYTIKVSELKDQAQN